MNIKLLEFIALQNKNCITMNHNKYDIDAKSIRITTKQVNLSKHSFTKLSEKLRRFERRFV